MVSNALEAALRPRPRRGRELRALPGPLAAGPRREGRERRRNGRMRVKGTGEKGSDVNKTFFVKTKTKTKTLGLKTKTKTSIFFQDQDQDFLVKTKTKTFFQEQD